MALLLPFALGCEAWTLLRYAVRPDAPVVRDGDEIAMPGLSAPVAATLRPDGLWRIEAAREEDALRVLGYVQARDRMAQLDLFRHLARGELAAWIGDRPFGAETALDADRRNRFLGFRDDARRLLDATSAEERAALGAFVDGINRWIEVGPVSLEHRLLGDERVRPWSAEDSLAIYLMIMHGLSGNADREIRRLKLACAVGVEAALRVWPAAIDFDVAALPPDAWPDPRPGPDRAVSPELAAALPSLCADAAAATPVDARRLPGPSLARLLGDGFSASNNWAVSGEGTASGAALLSSDPHLPHMNPPLLWGFEIATAEGRTAGFTIAGLHRVVFGHNGRVAWGATTNHVDRQDLVVHRPMRADGRDGVAREGGFEAFEQRTERFEVRGGEPVTFRVRFTRDGPLLNDLDPRVAESLPLVSLRRVPPGRGGDLDAARRMGRAHSAAELAAALEGLDLGCSSWLFADAEGHIGFRSPCLVPVRPGFRGSFPVPGWLDAYAWSGLVPKGRLPSADDPAQGWLATANGLVVPADRAPAPYNEDVSAPDRFRRIAARLAEARAQGGLTAEASAAIQLDVQHADWPALRAEVAPWMCADDPGVERAVADAARRMCAWDGAMRADRIEPTLFTLWNHALLDRALADELPGGAGDPLWSWVQSLLQFEADVHWLWRRPADDPVWDDVRSARVETRREQIRAAFADAVAEARRRFGGDPQAWRWGAVRPFHLRHPFASGGGPLGWWLNHGPFAVDGGTETVFKQQFPRSDREAMNPTVGPVARFTVDFAEPEAARFTLAGGQSGWPLSRHDGDLLDDWRLGRGRPLTPPPGPDDVRVRFVPAGLSPRAAAN